MLTHFTGNVLSAELTANSWSIGIPQAALLTHVFIPFANTVTRSTSGSVVRRRGRGLATSDLLWEDISANAWSWEWDVIFSPQDAKSILSLERLIEREGNIDWQLLALFHQIIIQSLELQIGR
jgi:hypothetical protein